MVRSSSPKPCIANEDYEATFEGEIDGTISVCLREADLDRRNRYRSKVYESLVEATLS